MSDEQRVRTPKPLGSMFVPEGTFYCIKAEGAVWGPFFNAFVAQQWAIDMSFDQWFSLEMSEPITTVPVSASEPPTCPE